MASIKHYEQAGLLPSTTILGGSVNYGEPHIHAIKLIKMAQDIGLSLREIMSVLSAKDSDQGSIRLNRALMLLNKRRDQKPVPQDAQEHTHTIDTLEKELAALFLP
ncbi:MAG: MerR family transcriptional regulator [Agarilytica sp.]